MKTIVLTVTTDLSYDQRMIRTCSALAEAGYDLLLIGRRKKNSLPLARQLFRQKRLFTFCEKGKWFYIEYNTRLFFYLLTRKADVFCAIDLDTILPVWLVSALRRKQRVYDAHELFCEMKEIVTRPGVYRIWKKIEKTCVPRFPLGYTVNQPIADEFRQLYGVQYGVIRNIPTLQPLAIPQQKEPFILYQGAVNEGRSFETLVPAMQWIDKPLVICGNGNFMEQLQLLIKKYGVTDKIVLKGMVPPAELRQITQKALLGFTLFENNGKSNYLSLANRFFDYIHAGTPQICVDYPAYAEINNQLQIAVVVKDISPENIAQQVNGLMANQLLYKQLHDNCLVLRQTLNWEAEKKTLIDFYKKIC